jgi:hypothetical protein
MDKIDHYISQALVLQEGDNVLLALSTEVDVDRATHIMNELKSRFPGVEFTVVAGVQQMAVQRA